jgi:hypothetical protein
VSPHRLLARLLVWGFVIGSALPMTANAAEPAADRTAGVAAFETVNEVLQHPRCANCHIPGDAPLQFDSKVAHQMNVQRGPDGKGAVGLPCATCHHDENSPSSYGTNAPPGAPHWALPPPNQKMAWIDLPAGRVCRDLKDPSHNGNRDLGALLKHVAEDKLVLWGWQPGGERQPVPIPHEQFVAAFKTWMAAGAPCPEV